MKKKKKAREIQNGDWIQRCGGWRWEGGEGESEGERGKRGRRRRRIKSTRAEERRVGKECSCLWSPDH